MVYSLKFSLESNIQLSKLHGFYFFLFCAVQRSALSDALKKAEYCGHDTFFVKVIFSYSCLVINMFGVVIRRVLPCEECRDKASKKILPGEGPITQDLHMLP